MLGGAVRQEESWCEEGPRWQACGAVTITRARGAQEPALSCICPHLPPSAAPFSGCLQPPSLGVPSSLGWNNLTFCAHFVLYLKEETFSQLKKKKSKTYDFKWNSGQFSHYLKSRIYSVYSLVFQLKCSPFFSQRKLETFFLTGEQSHSLFNDQ